MSASSGIRISPASGRWWAAGYAVLLTALIVGPLLGSGYLLLRDAVSTPRSYLTSAALGTGDAAPRAVPQDAALAVLSSVADGGLIVKAILVLALCCAGWGAAVLARELLGAQLGGQLLAVTVTLWNPFVAERLLQGHWSLFTGYAALPWTVLAAFRIRRAAPTGSRPRVPRWVTGTGTAWLLLAVALAAAALTPTGGVLAAAVALTLVPVRRWLPLLVLLGMVNAPWLAAALAGGSGGETSDPAGVPAFAARAEPGLGTIGSLAGLGGIWNAAAVPSSRTGLFALVATAVLLMVVLAGAAGLVRWWRRAPAPARVISQRLALLAALAIMLPALAATPWGLEAGKWLVAAVPGAGLLRDTQKYVALAVPGYALAAACLPRMAADWGRGAAAGARTGGIPVAGLLTAGAAAALLAVLPDLAWGVGGKLRPVHYPPAWGEVAAIATAGGDVAVLPGGMFRRFSFSGSAPVLDPAPRMLDRDVLQTGALPVAGGTVRGEGGRAGAVEQALLQGDSPATLARLGVGWVLVEHTTPGPRGDSARTLAQLHAVYSSPDLTLYRIDGAARISPPTAARAAICAAHVLWAGLLAAGLAGLLAARTLQWSRQRDRKHARTADPQ